LNVGRRLTAKRLMITADSGGSNGYGVRLWKVALQKLADELKLPITVCHLPPGTSKWNKIEHRPFSFITINWRGTPLRSYRTIVQLIAATTTNAGLKVRAELDEKKGSSWNRVGRFESLRGHRARYFRDILHFCRVQNLAQIADGKTIETPSATLGYVFI